MKRGYPKPETMKELFDFKPVISTKFLNNTTYDASYPIAIPDVLYDVVNHAKPEDKEVRLRDTILRTSYLMSLSPSVLLEKEAEQ